MPTQNTSHFKFSHYLLKLAMELSLMHLHSRKHPVSLTFLHVVKPYLSSKMLRNQRLKQVILTLSESHCSFSSLKDNKGIHASPRLPRCTYPNHILVFSFQRYLMLWTFLNSCSSPKNRHVKEVPG